MKIDFSGEPAGFRPESPHSGASAPPARVARPVLRPVPRPIPRQSRRPWLQLREAVLALAAGRARLMRHRERRWASVTFSGARHGLTLLFQGHEAVEAGERFIADLPNHEFAVARRFVAEAAITSVEHRALPEPELIVEAELLVLEEA